MKITASVNYNDAVAARVKTRLMEKGKAVRQNTVHVGLLEDAGSTAKTNYKGRASDASVVEVMLAHEFGAGVPERSWFRTWFDANANSMKLEMIEAKRAEYAGDRGAIEKLASKFASELKSWVASNRAGLAPLSDSTVAAREAAGLSSGPPLYATGQFVELIRAFVDGQDVGP